MTNTITSLPRTATFQFRINPKVRERVEAAKREQAEQEAAKKQVDGVTGATFTSEAMIQNVQKGLEYYQKNK